MPEVSVIIPCYNTAAYLGQAIESVLGQTWPDFEVIIVDDGSTDNTAEVAHSFDDARVQYVYQENKGLSGARNTGIRHASGKYLTFLDADDIFLPNKLEDQLTYLEEHPDIGLVAGGYLRIDARGKVLYGGKPSPGIVSREELLVASLFPVHTTLIRQNWIERVGYFDESLHAAEDWDFYCRLAVLGCPMYRIDKVVCAYRFVPGAMSTDPERQTKAMLRVVEKTFANGALSPRLAELEGRARGYTHLKGAVRCFGADVVDLGQQHLAQALKWDPGLRDGKYDKVLRLFIFWTDHMQIDSPDQYLETVFSNLPQEASDMRELRVYAFCLWRRRRFVLAWKNTAWLACLRLGCQLLFTNPMGFLLDVFRKIARCLQSLSLGLLCLLAI